MHTLTRGRRRFLPLRTGSAVSDIILIDQLPEGFTVRGFAADVRRAIRGG